MNLNEPAFPEFRHPTKVTDNPQGYWMVGLTKREEFAKAAMQGIISEANHDLSPYGKGEHYTVAVARIACECADALIAELSKDDEDHDLNRLGRKS